MKTLAEMMALVAANIPPEPFFGAWSMQERGSATSFRIQKRDFLVMNPLDLAAIPARHASLAIDDPKAPLLSRPFMGVTVRDLDHDEEARSEYLTALREAIKGLGNV